MFEIRNKFAISGSRIAAAFFVISMCSTISVGSALACTQIDPPPTAKEIFDRSSSVFKGIVTSAELIDVTEFVDELNLGDIGEDELKDFPIVKVRWRVKELFKGPPVEGGSAFIGYVMCVDDLIVVGLPYVFSLSPIKGDFPRGLKLRHPDLIGSIDTAGTGSILGDDGNSSQKLEEAFRSLSQKK